MTNVSRIVVVGGSIRSILRAFGVPGNSNCCILRLWEFLGGAFYSISRVWKARGFTMIAIILTPTNITLLTCITVITIIMVITLLTINEVNEVTSFLVSNLCERVAPLQTDPHGRGRQGEGEREG